MKIKLITLVLFSFISCFLACKDQGNEKEAAPILQAPINTDTAVNLLDTQTTYMLEQLKNIQQMFKGNFKVSNASNKVLKETKIDSLGNISNSTLYKTINIYPATDKNLVLFSKGIQENALNDTFEFEFKNNFIYLYSILTIDEHKHIRNTLVYKFEKIK